MPQSQPGAVVVDLYGLWGNRTLTLTQHPLVATITFDFDGKPHSLKIVSPDPYTEVVRICDPFCHHIVVVDRNREEPNCLEYARYRVEFRSEDDLIASFVADNVEIEAGA